MGTLNRGHRSVRTWIEIDRQALAFNFARFRKLAGGARVMAVVKSNAYGHGLTLVASLLAGEKGETGKEKLWFGVDSIVEALRLRREGIKNRILVLGYTLPERYADAARRGITVTVSNFDALRAFGRVKRRPAFHLKLDTGMHRQGFLEREIPELARMLHSKRLAPDGAYSHYAAAERAIVSRRQRQAFERCIGAVEAAGIPLRERHIAATGGMVSGRNPRWCTMVRIGLGLYGYLPDGKAQGAQRTSTIALKPVMTWKTIVGEVKRVEKGEGIGYDLTERLRRDSDVAILPIGYWHGFDRGLSSIGEVLVRGRRAKVLGRVSMDMTAVDVTDINRAAKSQKSNVTVGDEAVLIGRQGREFIGAGEVAATIGTTAYEILTRLNPLIRRIPV